MAAFWRRSSVVAVLTLAGWFGFCEPAVAQVPPDALLTYQARHLLDEDEKLSPFNIGVLARNGEVRLVGKLPSEALIKKAEDLLRRMKGVYLVRSEIQIGPMNMLDSPRILADTPSLKETRRTETVSLLPPIGVQSESSKPKSSPVAQLAPRTTGVGSQLTKESPSEEEPTRDRRDQTLAAAVQEIRWTDQRFVGIQVDVRKGTVILRGQVARGEDAMDLARKVGRIPGVEGVILETKTVPALPGRSQ